MIETALASNLTTQPQKSSIFFKIQELFYEKLKIKICPIPLNPYSKVPSVRNWTDFDPTVFSWVRHPGNVGILLGKSKLLVFDCDTTETVSFFEELAKKINLPLNTLIVQTRKGRHYYYLCNFSNELERKQFYKDQIKLDVIAGNKYQVVAPYSLLKLDQNNQILDAKAENYILFEYTPLNIPEKLVEISKDTYNQLITELEKTLLQTKEKRPAPPTPQTFKREQGEQRELNDEEIEKLSEIVSQYFQEGRRQNLLLYLAGYLRKDLNISEESVYKLYESLHPIDDPDDRQYRLEAIKRSFMKGYDDIAGKSKLVEILGEKPAEELLQKIEKALGIPQKTKKKKKDDEILDENFLEQLYTEMQNEEEKPQTTPQEKEYVYVEIHRKSKKFARCNYHDLVIEYGAFEKNEFIDKYHYIVHHKVFDCCIDKIYAIENPLTNEKKYEVHFVSKNPEEAHKSLKGNLQEVWEGLKTTSYILNSSVAQNVLTAVFSHYLKQGWYEKRQEDLQPGFYYINGQLIASKFEEKDYTKEDLQKAATFLNDYIYSHPNPTLIASILKAGLLLPFSFAQKQAVISGKLRKRMRYLYLTGETKSGKTTTAMLLSRIWTNDDKVASKISYASFCTEARAAKHLSNSTHILIVDEVNKDLEVSTVKELLKFAQEDTMARIILSKAQKQIHYPALSAIIMTSNSHFPSDPALLERFLVFRFRKHDKISATARAKYEKEDFNKLWPIAQYTWRYIKSNGLKDDYIGYATEILKAFYKEAEIYAEWLDWKFTHDTAETEEEQEYTKEAEFFNAVLKFFLQHIRKEKEETLAKSIYTALSARQFGRWIWADDNLFIYVSRDFLLELRRSYRCEIKDLEEVKEMTGWKKMYKRDHEGRVWVLQTTVMDLFYRLNLTPRLLNSYEFKDWINNRLTLKSEEEIVSDDTVENTINDKEFPF
jgi:hypothetical protein